MRTLKLKKINISRVGNPHTILAGAQQHGQGNAQQPDHPTTYTLDTKIDETCKPGTNGGGTLGRTTGVPIDYNHNGL